MKTYSVTISEEALNLVKAEAEKDDRSTRSWLDRYLRSTLPLTTPAPQLDRLISTPTLAPTQTTSTSTSTPTQPTQTQSADLYNKSYDEIIKAFDD